MKKTVGRGRSRSRSRRRNEDKEEEVVKKSSEPKTPEELALQRMAVTALKNVSDTNYNIDRDKAWMESTYAKSIIRLVELGKITGYVLACGAVVLSLGSIRNYIGSVVQLNIRDRYDLFKIKDVNNVTEANEAIQAQFNSEAFAEQTAASFRNMTATVPNYEKIIDSYVISRNATERYIGELIVFGNGNPPGNIYSMDRLLILQEKLRNGSMTQAEFDNIRSTQLLASKYVMQGVSDDLNVNIEMARNCQKIKEEYLNAQDVRERNFNITRRVLLKHRDQSEGVERLGNRLDVTLSPVAFVKDLIKELHARVDGTRLAPLATFLTSHYGLQLITTFANSIHALVDSKLQTIPVNQTDVNKEKIRLEIAMGIMANFGVFITEGDLLMMAGLAIASDALHVITIAYIAGFICGGVNYVFVSPMLKRWMTEMPGDFHDNVIEKDGKPTYPGDNFNQSKYIASGLTKPGIFILQTTETFLNSLHVSFTNMSMYPFVSGTLLFMIGYASKKVYSGMQDLPDITLELFSLDSFLNVTSIVPVIAAGVILVHNVTMDIWSSETEVYLHQVSKSTMNMFSKSIQFIEKFHRPIAVAAGFTSFLFALNGQMTTPYDVVFKVFNATTGLLGEKNDLDVFYWKIREDEKKKKWDKDTPSPPLLRLGSPLRGPLRSEEKQKPKQLTNW